jgi:diacylglycerol kinase family enzyme
MNDDPRAARPIADAASAEDDAERTGVGRTARVLPKPRVVLVVNPRVRARVSAALWRSALGRLEGAAAIVGSESTRGDADDPDRIRSVVREQRPDVLVAAGGDGTVNQAVEGLLAAGAPAPALAILPLGTANNVARSLGLLSCRHLGEVAVELAVRVVARGRERAIDLGRVGGRHFVGSFAAGMDADILTTRNRWHRIVGTQSLLSGYPLYLVSCAANLLRSRHGARSRVIVDGSATDASAYNVLVTNTALYAGEFRFDPGDPSSDGRLDLQVMTGAVEYVRLFVGAWRRYLGVRRGRLAPPPSGLQRVRAVAISCRAPVPSQLDGEELWLADRYEIRVLPGALRVRVPDVGPTTAGST